MDASEINDINEIYIKFIENMQITLNNNTDWTYGYNCAIEDIIQALKEQVIYRKMKFIIAGGRDFSDYQVVEKVCNQFPNITEIISGCALGADKLGEKYAEINNIPIKYFPADWETYGKSAGFIRNAEMGEYADAAICFWDGKSKGTKHMIQTMKFNKKLCYVYDYKGNRTI